MAEDDAPIALLPVPMGYRDLYWCWIINEPALIRYPEPSSKFPHCTTCDGEIRDADGDDGLHSFLGHIPKPRTEELGEEARHG